MTKENLFQFIKKEATLERPVEVFGEMEMLEWLDQFFSRATYYAAMGYEREVAEQAFAQASEVRQNLLATQRELCPGNIYTVESCKPRTKL